MKLIRNCEKALKTISSCMESVGLFSKEFFFATKTQLKTGKNYIEICVHLLFFTV